MAGTTKLLLMGIVGQGKSTLGNFMVRDPDTFKTYTSMASVTGVAKKAMHSRIQWEKLLCSRYSRFL